MASGALAGAAVAAALVAAVAVAGCGGPDGPSGPRLVVGDGPIGDEWEDVGDGTGPSSRGPAPGFSPPRPAPSSSPTPEPAEPDPPASEPDPDPDPRRDPSSAKAWLALEPGEGDPSAFRVTGHSAGADWSAVAISADAGDWIAVVDGGAGGEYPLGSGQTARPESWDVDDGALLSFCDASGVDGVVATTVHVTDPSGGQAYLRDRIQAPAC